MEEARVIENDIQKAVGLDVLQEGILAINAKIDKAVKAVSDYSISDEAMSALSYKDAKRYEQELSGMVKSADDERKAFKRDYNRPLNEIERRYKEAMEPVTALHERYKAQRLAKEQEEKDAKKEALRQHYEDFAGLLVPVVPYEKLHNPKWLNLTVKMTDAEIELEEKVEEIAAHWDLLKKMNFESQGVYAEIEAHFFDTLDLDSAIKYGAKLVEDRRKIEEMKAAMAQPEPEPEPTSEPEPEPMPEPEPAYEPMPEPEPMPAPAYEPVPAPAAEAPRYVPSNDVAHPMVMVIGSCTVAQAVEIGLFCGSIGVTGAFKHGTLKEVYEREQAIAVARERESAKEAVHGRS